jgi:DHA1 family putative efflux transporter-like MFS transporter
MKNKIVVYLLALAVFLIGTIEYIITGIIQLMATDLTVSTSIVGLFVTAFALSAAIGSPIVIALTINFDRKKILLTSLAVFIISNFITFFSPTFEMVLFTRILQGLSGGIFTVVAMGVATRLVEKDKKGNAIGIILMGLSSSLVIGVPMGTFLSDIMGWRSLFILIGLLTIIPLIVVYKNIPNIKEKNPVTIGMQLSLLKDIRIVMGVVITLFYIGSYSTLFTYVTPFLQASSNLTMKEISGILFLAGICSFVGSRIGGLTADKKGPRFTIYMGLSLQVLMLLLLSIVGENLAILIAVIMVWMTATWSTSPAQQLYLVTLVPKSPDIALSVNTSFIQFGFALGSGLGGLVVGQSSVLNLSWVGFIIVVLALLMAFMIFSYKEIFQS